MEVKFFPVAMVMMELWGGLPRSEMLEKGKLVSRQQVQAPKLLLFCLCLTFEPK